MPKIKFTAAFVKDAKPGAALIDWSALNKKGLHLRITPNGVKTYLLSYRSRITGKPENKTMGRHPEISLATAFDWADDAWKLIAAGKPVEFTAAKKDEPSVSDVLAIYDQRKLSTMRSGDDILTALTTLVTTNGWGDLPFTSLLKPQIMDALRHIAHVRGAKRSAGNKQQMVCAWMNWAVINDFRPFNPIAGQPCVGGDAEPRDRILKPAELQAVWRACHSPAEYGLHQVYADAILLILTTGCRPGMACGLVEEELFSFGDFSTPDYRDDAGPLADFPAERMKMGVPFILPLNSLALSVIKRRLGNGRVLFPTPSKEYKDKGKQVRVRRLSAITKELSDRLGFKEHFTPHDLRRTASALLCREYPEEQVGLLLAHEGKRGVMKHYNPQKRWNDLVGKREMSDRLASMIKEVVDVKLRVVAETQRAA